MKLIEVVIIIIIIIMKNTLYALGAQMWNVKYWHIGDWNLYTLQSITSIEKDSNNEQHMYDASEIIMFGINWYSREIWNMESNNMDRCALIRVA